MTSVFGQMFRYQREEMLWTICIFALKVVDKD